MAEFSSWRDYWRFAGEVVGKRRYIFSDETNAFLSAVAASCEDRVRPLREDMFLWRAQIGCLEEEDEEGVPVFTPYPGDRMKPQKNLAGEGRVNSKGIPCLYTATDPSTAISEVRSQIGATLTVASLFPARELRIVDCGSEHNMGVLFLEEPEALERETAVWGDINKAFSRPVTRSENRGEYAPTQILAELFRTRGFDGVAYQSGYGESGYNIALFDPTTATIASCWVYRVDDMKHSVSVMSEAGVRTVNAVPPGRDLMRSMTAVITNHLKGRSPIETADPGPTVTQTPDGEDP